MTWGWLKFQQILILSELFLQTVFSANMSSAKEQEVKKETKACQSRVLFDLYLILQKILKTTNLQ